MKSVRTMRFARGRRYNLATFGAYERFEGGSQLRPRRAILRNSPRVEATATTDGSSSTATPAIDLPSGIAAGDILLAAISVSTAPVTLDWPAGWTEMAEGVQGSTDDVGSFAYRIADGTEGATITVTLGAASLFAAASCRIGGGVQGRPKLVQNQSVSNASSAVMNPTVVQSRGEVASLLVFLACMTGDVTVTDGGDVDILAQVFNTGSPQTAAAILARPLITTIASSGMFDPVGITTDQGALKARLFGVVIPPARQPF